MCRASALWLMRRAIAGGTELEILPCRRPPRRERFPHITDETCMTAMQLVLPDGRVLSGADAVPEILRRIRGWRWVAGVFRSPVRGPSRGGSTDGSRATGMRLSCRLPARH